MAICKLCGQEKAHAFIFAAGSTVCTEDALEIVRVATSIGLVDMGKKLHDHHIANGPRVSPIGGKQV